jgi:hypothetical protein
LTGSGGANAQDKTGHAAIRTVKRWVVLPIADLVWRLHRVVWRNLTGGAMVNELLCTL